MKSERAGSKSWKSIIGLTGVAILGCGICCLPLIAPIVASAGATLSLGACVDELSYWHFMVLAGIGLTTYFVMRWRRQEKAKACQQVCPCEHACETSKHTGET